MIPARIVGIFLLILPNLTHANSAADQCDVAAVSAALKVSIPSDVMLALTRVETGRNRNGKFEPWPWTVNMEGKGYWFDTRDKAVDFVAQSYASGARSFDIGCFQINHRWHGQEFTSFEQMFDPVSNAGYAAKFVKSLYKEGGSWSWAAGAYHSRTTTLAAKYRTRFDQILTNLTTHPTTTTPPLMAAANDPIQLAKPSTWNPFQPIEIESVSVKNGSLASGLIAQSVSPLLGAPVGALF